MPNLLKSRNVFFLLALQFFICEGYSQDILWEKSYGGKQADYLMDVQPTADYGFILAGSSLSKKSGNKAQDNNGDLDYWVWKMDEKGDLDWQKNFGGSASDFLQSIALTKDGGFILAGTSVSEKGLDKQEDSRGEDDFWIIKLNAKGGEEWQKTIGGSGQEKLQCIYQTKDGGYILGGSSSSDISGEKIADSFGNMDYWVVKLDSKGKIEWQKTIGGIYVDELRSIEQTNDGGFILGGYSNSPASGNKTDDNIGVGDYWVIKLDVKGVIKWQKTIGGDKDDQLYVVHQTYDGNYILGGNSNSGSSDSKSKGNEKGTDFWLLKLDNEGAILWQETYNIGNVDVLTSLIENDDHSLLLGGYAQGETVVTNQITGKSDKTEKGIDDYVAIKINEKGEELWRQNVGSEGEDRLRKAIQTRDGGYLLAGTSNPQSVANASNAVGGMNGNGMQNKQLQNKIDKVNNTISDTTNDVNNAIKDKTTNVVNKINDTVGNEPDSRFKFGLNTPTGTVGLPSLGSGDASNSSNGSSVGGINEKKLPISRDKKNNFGSNDFWVVKLKDKTKPEKIKASIEAFPNPTLALTNVIVGYDFESGSATVADLAGHVLQQFAITSRTVPVDLSAYPMGIYIVNIKTNVQSDGVKIIKGISKN